MRTIILCLLVSAAAWAQTAERALINVTGEAELWVIPDEVQMTFGVETRHPVLKDAREENDKLVAEIIRAAEREGVDKTLIQTSHMSVEPVYDRRKGSTGMDLAGYRINKTINVIVRDVSTFGDVLSVCLEAGANRMQGLRFSSTKQAAHESEARRAAMRDARERATLMAGEIGQTVGKAFSITESHAQVFQPQERMAMAMVADAAPAPRDTVSLGRIRIAASVSVSFDLQ